MTTAKAPEKVKPNKNGEEEHGPLYDTVRKVALASIGAFALAQEEVEEFIKKLVDRGEIAEKDGRKLMKELMERRKKETAKAEDEMNKRVEDILDRMNVPTKSDIEALGDKIATLSKKVDDLKKSQTPS